jgi:hypothetical protein
MPVQVVCKNCGKICFVKPFKAKTFSYCSIKCKHEGMSAKIPNQESMTVEELKKARKALSDSKYYETNADKLKQKSIDFYTENKTEINQNLQDKYANDEAFRQKAIERTRKNLNENRERINTRRKELHQLNPEVKREQHRRWVVNNPVKVRENARRNYQLHRESRALRQKAYNEKNKSKRREYLREYKKLRLQIDLNYKAKETLASRIRSAIKNAGGIKSCKTIELVGCTPEFLTIHIESQFESWMTWENWGMPNANKRTWQIDHIVPLSHFNLTKEEEQKKAFHWSNCRPLDSIQNISEGNRR